jgi:hypothetical protein
MLIIKNKRIERVENNSILIIKLKNNYLLNYSQIIIPSSRRNLVRGEEPTAILFFAAFRQILNLLE